MQGRGQPPYLLIGLLLMSAGFALVSLYLAVGGGAPAQRVVQAGALSPVPPPTAPPLTPVVASPSPTSPPVVASAPTLPPSAALGRLEIPNHKQERNLNCEFRSAADLATYYGWEITWEELFAVVGHDASGDPNQGFVGRSMDDPPGSLYPLGYGVHAGPVARGLRRLGMNATAHEQQSVAWLKERLSAGHPTIIWALGGMIVGPVVEWQTTDGLTVRGASYEHTFTVVGYDEQGVWVNDPYTATTDYYLWPRFEASWEVLGRMAVTIDEERQEIGDRK